MLLNVILLIASLACILLASILFTNGIELLGHRLKFHQGAVGSILAAVGTALPETIIPVVAILILRDHESHEVGIGAIAGAPFMLGTLAFFVTGVAVVVYWMLGKRSLTMRIDHVGLTKDLTYFVGLYGAAILTTFVHDYVAAKEVVALGLVVGYIGYVRSTLRSEGLQNEEVDPLFVSRLFRVEESRFWIVTQVVASLVLMVVSAHFFVRSVSAVSIAMGVSTLVLSMIITPIATELPEKCNSVIWVGKKKDVLAMGNITGAMVFQSSCPVVFGVLFTHWDLRGPPMVSAALAFVSAVLLLAWVRWRKTLNPFVLMVGGLLYLLFLFYLKFGM